MTAKVSVVCQKQSNNSYFAICPEIAGCYTQGDTYEDALERIRELVIETLREEKESIVLGDVYSQKQFIFSEMSIDV